MYRRIYVLLLSLVRLAHHFHVPLRSAMPTAGPIMLTGVDEPVRLISRNETFLKSSQSRETLLGRTVILLYEGIP